MENKTCDMCHQRPAVRFNETVRKAGGHGTIMNLCYVCMAKLPAINKKNRMK